MDLFAASLSASVSYVRSEKFTPSDKDNLGEYLYVVLKEPVSLDVSIKAGAPTELVSDLAVVLQHLNMKNYYNQITRTIRSIQINF